MPDPRLHPIPSVTTTFGTVNNATSVAVAANPNRLDLEIVNDSDVVVYLARGNDAVIGSGIRLNPNGGSYSMDTQNLFLGAISAICATDANLTISEGTSP